MRNTTMRKTITILILITVSALALSAHPLRTYNHEFNPALLGVRSRGVFEVGSDTNFAFGNSSFAFSDILTEEVVLDFNELSDDLNGNDFSLDFMTSVGGHWAVTLFGISFGSYTDLSGIMSIEVPNGLFDFVADGNTIDSTDSDSSAAYARVFFETGLYGGYRWNDYQFSAKLGAFSPILYSGSDAEFAYSFTTRSDPDPGQAHMEAEVSLNIPYYSVFDLSDDGTVNGDEILTGLNGINFSVGAIKVKNKKAMYGASITGLTIIPAQATYKSQLAMESSVALYDPAANAEDPDSLLAEDFNDPEFTTLSEGNYAVSTPLQIGGFYRLTGFPGFIDWIGHAQFTFDDEFQYGAGIAAEGAFFPLSWFSLGMEYDRVLWKTTLGLKADLHIFEIGMDMGFAGSRFLGMFTANGLQAKLYMALGL